VGVRGDHVSIPGTEATALSRNTHGRYFKFRNLETGPDLLRAVFVPAPVGGRRGRARCLHGTVVRPEAGAERRQDELATVQSDQLAQPTLAVGYIE